MPVLASQQRRFLEDACSKGRRAAEQAVRAALTSLAVTAERPPAHLDEEERQLRRGLRVKARQLGDTGASLDLLVAECAYEQWHRLLFARFLAENNLLIHPEYHAPVTIEDCDELAESLGESDGWAVAASFAAEILPGIFRLDDPCVRLRLAPEGRLALEAIVAGIPAAVFGSDDALGWVYQYWQKDKKDEVNASERKIGGADLGPVTQLFTENYMVRFLLENSLGAWWAARHPDSPLVRSFKHLRFDADGLPASGTFDSWPDRIAKVTVLDPCCGSGHFLVEAFSMLWQMRAEEEALTPLDAQDAVLRDNLFGLELDPRCVQIAMFAVAMQAWKLGGGWRSLPVPNIACSGIPVNAPASEWMALADRNQQIEHALTRLHILFRQAETLGSLIDPKRAAEASDPTGLQRSLEDVDWDQIAPILSALITQDIDDPARQVLGADVGDVARAADFLSRHYELIATNPPFLGRPKQDAALCDYAARYHASARHDLATVFLHRALPWANSVAFVLPQGWTFLKRSNEFRQELLLERTLRTVAWLGEGAFESLAAAGAFSVLAIIDSDKPGLLSTSALFDVRNAKGVGEKADGLRSGDFNRLEQSVQRENPEWRILPAAVTGTTLRSIADTHQGIKTGDNPRFVRFFWELPAITRDWRRMQSAPLSTAPFVGREQVAFWEDGFGQMADVTQAGATFRGQAAWGHTGIVAAEMRSLYATFYTGELFDGTGTVVIPKISSDLGLLWAFISSPEFHAAVRSIDNSLKITSGTILDVPIDVERWRAVSESGPPLPEPWTDEPTQWLFDGRPEAAIAPLQVAVARMVGFSWPEHSEPAGLEGLVDADGVVCLPSVAGEPPAADRLQQLLSTAWESSWSPGRQEQLLEETGSKKKNIADWLRDDFFKQHCALFGNRPFVWHIWDGQRDGFAALVNYHRLDRKTLEKLTYTYLGDWIERQRAEVRDGKAGAEVRLAAALKLRSSLELILEGERPYDIYVRWKSLSEQPIGWDPDINDGVRVNVRPFVEAGVLRSSFNIHWRKDRGKNPDGSERLNDLHFTAAEKRATRNGS